MRILLYVDSLGCEKITSQGRRCGVPPIGRCSTCNDAMCTSHRALGGGGRLATYVIIDLCVECIQREREEQQRKTAELQQREEQYYSTDPADPHMNFQELSEFFRGKKFPYRRLTPQSAVLVAKALKAAGRVQHYRTIQRPLRSPLAVHDGGWCIGGKTVSGNGKRSSARFLFIEADGQITLQTRSSNGEKTDTVVKPRKVTVDEMLFLHKFGLAKPGSR